MYSDQRERDRILPRERSSILEGEYSNWVHIWNMALPNTLAAPNNRVAHIDDLHELVYYSYVDLAGNVRLLIVNARTGVVVFLSPALVSYHWFSIQDIGRVYASRQRYIHFMRGGSRDVEVWYNGALLWTDDIQTYFVGGLAIFTWMSFSARWLVCGGRDRIWCFEGA